MGDKEKEEKIKPQIDNEEVAKAMLAEKGIAKKDELWKDEE